MKKCVIAIDVGTSGCKAIAVDESGAILSGVIGEYPLYQPQPGWTEQDPADWWRESASSVKQVLSEIGDAEVCAIGLSGQMHGMVALDGSGEVVRNAILWNDQRTQKQCDEITAAAGGLSGLLGYTNNMMLTGYTGGKILWMKEEEPGNYARTKTVVNPKDYIGYKLTRQLSTEVSDASGTGLFDVEHRVWAWELIDKIGLKREFFTKALESTDQMGTVTPEASALTGLPAGTPVYAGGGDAVISTTGMGLITPGRIGVSLGTSGVVAAGLPGYAENKDGLLQLFCNNAPERWMAFGCTLSAAGSLQWFRDALGGGDNYRALDDQAEAIAPGADGLLFLPYLTGERCPLFDPEAKGAFLGIQSVMGKGHFSRAVLEGVAFSLRQVFDLIRSASPGILTDEIVISGGGAKSPLWQQILADIFQLPVRTVHGSAEGSAFGAALVAGTGCGMWPSIDKAMEVAIPENETLPNPDNFPIYQRQYDKYIKMYDALKWSF